MQLVLQFCWALKALLYRAIFFATCLAILLRYKLQEKLLSVTYPEMNMSRNLFVAAIVARSSREGPFYFSQRSSQRCDDHEFFQRRLRGLFWEECSIINCINRKGDKSWGNVNMQIIHNSYIFERFHSERLETLRRIPLNVRAISAKNIYQKTTHSTVTF